MRRTLTTILKLATPYYYEADLQTWKIKAEFTASEEAAYYRFTFPASPHAHFILTLGDGAELAVTGENAVEGSQKIDGPVGKISDADRETREYFYAVFSRPFKSYQTWGKEALCHAAKQTGRQYRHCHGYCDYGRGTD